MSTHQVSSTLVQVGDPVAVHICQALMIEFSTEDSPFCHCQDYGRFTSYPARPQMRFHDCAVEGSHDPANFSYGTWQGQVQPSNQGRAPPLRRGSLKSGLIGQRILLDVQGAVLALVVRQ